MLFCTAIAIAMLCAVASYLSKFRDRNLTIVVMLACAVCALIRGINGQNRRDLINRYFQYHGTPLYNTKYILPDHFRGPPLDFFLIFLCIGRFFLIHDECGGDHGRAGLGI